ncbi:MAG TPA: hypothetical protein VK181_08160 [Rhizobium sp.]|nr:hypothetical protein [Rhizobium sp.]
MTYGQIVRERVIAEHVDIAAAALGGSRECLEALLELTAQSSYTEGFAAASATAGFPL